MSRGSSHVEPESGEAAADERLPERRVVGGDSEVRGQGQIAAKADGPALHAADHGQMDAMDEFDHAIGGVRNASNQVAGAGPLADGVGRHPVRARAEIASRAADMDRPKRIVGRGGGQQHRRTLRSLNGSTRCVATGDRA